MEPSNEPKELIHATLRQLEGTTEHLRLISDGFKKGAEMFRLEDAAEANEHYLMSLDALQHFLRFIENIHQTFDLDFTSIIVEAQSVSERPFHPSRYDYRTSAAGITQEN